jgi:hypothetical protein
VATSCDLSNCVELSKKKSSFTLPNIETKNLRSRVPYKNIEAAEQVIILYGSWR